MSIGHHFKLVHQSLHIERINFEQRFILGSAEFHLLPEIPGCNVFRLNCKQSRIISISVNDLEAEYDYDDPSLQIVPEDSTLRSLDSFQNNHAQVLDSVDSEKRLGELVIYMPSGVSEELKECKAITLVVNFALVEPRGGIHFVLPRMEDGTLLRNAMHMFSYGNDNSSRLWFPCIDSYSELCTWKIYVTTDTAMTAVSCGDLVDVTNSSDCRQKIHTYELNVPTSACNIALAVGPFELHTDSNMNEVKHYCLPHLMPILKHSTQFLYEAFEFYEELLSIRYPYPTYKQVFVDEAYADSQTYSSMTIFNTNLLHSAQVIDQHPDTRLIQAASIAKQFFGSFISRCTWYDAWLASGISLYLAHQYQKNTFGNNVYRTNVKQMLTDVCNYELNVTPVILDPSNTHSRTYFGINNPQTLPARYSDILDKKSFLVLRMLENRLGKELLLQVFNKMLSLAVLSATSDYNTGMWENIMISTKSFIQSIFTVTGKDMQVFADQWVHQSGCARFNGSFIFNRKRNVVELELKQEMSGKGIFKYVGPLTVTIQELDGSFNHTFKIEENKYRFEITCHSKSRRHKKKKIPLMTGEEVDMDLTRMDADSPVLWLRIDPDMQVLRTVQWQQPDFMWQYQLRHERDVVAQLESLDALEGFATPETRKSLMDTIDHDQCFYKVRMQSAECLVKVANQMVSSWAGPPAMMNIYRKMFGSHSCPTVVRQHKFKNFQQYFLQQSIPVAMAKLRNQHSICPLEVLKFISDLFKYSDNSRNKWSDCYYTSSLIDALTLTITPAVTVIGNTTDQQVLSSESRLILDEITRLLNMEKLLPSYRNVITSSCLRCIRTLQKNGHLPSTSTIFKNYAQYGMFVDIRIQAFDIITGFLEERGDHQQGVLDFLLDAIDDEPVPRVAYHTIKSLVDCSSSLNNSSSVDTVALVDRLWSMMNKFASYDSKLSAEVIELYYRLHGLKKPILLKLAGEMDGDYTAPSVVHQYHELNPPIDIDESSMQGGSDFEATSKSRVKKKKKKNKHKHKSNKSERRELEREEASSSQHAQQDFRSSMIVQDTVLTLSEPSSPEPDL